MTNGFVVQINFRIAFALVIKFVLMEAKNFIVRHELIMFLACLLKIQNV